MEPRNYKVTEAGKAKGLTAPGLHRSFLLYDNQPTINLSKLTEK